MSQLLPSTDDSMRHDSADREGNTRGRSLALVVVGGVMLATWLCSGVTPRAASLFIFYELLYVVAPGCLAYLTLSPRPRGWMRTLALGWPLGYAIEVGAYALTAGLQARAAFAYLPLISVALVARLLMRARSRPSLAVIRLRLAHRGREVRRSSPDVGSLLIAFAISVALLELALTWFPTFPLPPHIQSITYPTDSVFVLALAAEARHHWPMTTPWVAGLPLRYYIAAFLHGAAINQVTGVSLPTVYFRLLPSTMTLLVSVQLASLARSIRRPALSGALAVLLYFAVAAATLNPVQNWPLEGASLKFFWLSPTFAFSAIFLLALLVLVQEWSIRGLLVSQRAWPTRSGYGSRARDPQASGMPHHSSAALISLSVLVLACAASKTFAALDFLGGLGLFWLWSAARKRAPRLLLYALVASVGAVATAYLALLSGGGAGAMKIMPFQPIFGGTRIDEARQFAQSLAGHSVLWIVVLGCVLFVMFACLLAPVLGVIWLLLRRIKFSQFEVLCLFVVLTGFAAFLLLRGPYAAEEYFRDLGYIAIVPVAAGGLADFWSCTPANARRSIAVASASVLVIGVVIAGGSWLLALSGHAARVWFLAMYALVVLFIGIFAFRLSRGYVRLLPSRPRRVIACCVPLLGALGLIKPMAFAAVGARATILRQRIAAVDSPAAYGMTAALYRGLIWVRTHTRECDVLAVNNHSGFPHFHGQPSVYLYYSAFTERRIFLESWLYTPSGIAGHRPFPRRLPLNEDAVLRGSPAALADLAREGVDYVLVDKTHGTGAREPSSVSRLVFNNSALAVYRLLPQANGRSTRLGCGVQRSTSS